MAMRAGQSKEETSQSESGRPAGQPAPLRVTLPGPLGHPEEPSSRLPTASPRPPVRGCENQTGSLVCKGGGGDRLATSKQQRAENLEGRAPRRGRPGQSRLCRVLGSRAGITAGEAEPDSEGAAAAWSPQRDHVLPEEGAYALMPFRQVWNPNKNQLGTGGNR